MFSDAISFDQDLSSFDTGNAKTLQGMFRRASAFNQSQSLSTWNTFAVEDMDELFLGSSFDADLSSWETNALTSMRLMFAQDKVFNSPIFQDTSNVLRMAGAFFNAISFNQSLSAWDVSQTTGMDSLFFAARSYQEVLCWDLNNSVVVDDMFCGSGASFNESCVRFEGLIAKTLSDCSRNPDAGEEEEGSAAAESMTQRGFYAVALLMATISVALF